MQVVVAVDSFKGSLTSVEAGQAIKEGILRAVGDAEVLVCPIADGGEGTVAALVHGMKGSFRQTEVTGPLGERVVAKWGIIGGKTTGDPQTADRVEKTAVIEMAAAAGLILVEPARRNPLYTTTYGVGELIREAIREGCRHFIIGIGGSATNDGGVGMLEALGFAFLNSEGQRIPRGAIGLAELKSIDSEGVDPALEDCTFRIVCDVQNPLCGPNGCSHVFASQKGASEAQIVEMDAWLGEYARIVGDRGDPEMPGAGAAGGLGFAFSAFTNAKLERGIDIVMDETGLETKIQNADIVITGFCCRISQTNTFKILKVCLISKLLHTILINLILSPMQVIKFCDSVVINVFTHIISFIQCYSFRVMHPILIVVKSLSAYAFLV